MKAYIINSIALALYFLFAGFSIGGVLLTWRLCGWSRLIGVLFGFLGLSAAALLTFMSSKYWFGDEDFFAAFIDINIVQLAIQTVVTLGALGIAVVVCWGLARWTRQRLERHQSLRWVAVPLFVLMLLAGSGIAGLITLSQKDKPVPVVAAERQLHIAAGFQATIYAETQIHAPTSMAVGPDQRLYISDFKGRIWAITDQNGIASTPQLFADKLDRPVGIAWRGDQLYVAVHGKILILQDGNADGVADRQETIISDLPARIYPLHQNNGLAFGPDGRLYFPVGSTTDDKQESQGLAAAILSANPDGSDLKVYARGIRNAYDLAFNRAGDLFATENQPAGLPVVPGEELNQIVADGNYGYPYYYEQAPPDSGTRSPLYVFPPHSSPNGITFYEGQDFPAEFADNGFVVSWMRGELYRVQLSQLSNGDYTSRVSLFVTGMQNPLDVVTGPGDALYVADYGSSTIYRIAYLGDSVAQQASQADAALTDQLP